MPILRDSAAFHAQRRRLSLQLKLERQGTPLSSAEKSA